MGALSINQLRMHVAKWEGQIMAGNTGHTRRIYQDPKAHVNDVSLPPAGESARLSMNARMMRHYRNELEYRLMVKARREANRGIK